MSSTGKITITGLREYQRSLRAMDAGLPKMLRLVFNDAVGLVIDWAKPRIPQRTGRARGSLKAKSSQRTAGISIGGNRAPWVPWLDFGGEGRRKGRPPNRPFLKDGRYVYEGLRVKRADVTEVMSAGMIRLAREAGFEAD
jgi:hypothetical protein